MDPIKRLLYAAFVFTLATHALPAQADTPRGAIRGTVTDAESRQALPGSIVMLHGTRLGTTADVSGNFEISNVPVGSYTVVFSSVGYVRTSKTDIVVSSGRTTFVEGELTPSEVRLDSVVTTGGFFSRIDAQGLSAASFSAEEIRRQAGSAGDVSRVLFGLPSMAKINDSRNSLIVRGGSPIENGFYLDNIEIPNINHYPVQGSSDGPIGLVNVEFIRDVNFYSGGFSPVYGDRLSSIMDLSFREGNRQNFQAQLDMSLQGLGAVAEGPLSGGRGSWFLSARRSYLDLIFKFVDFGAPVPAYGDIQGKVVYDLSEKHRLSLLGLVAIDKVSQNRDDALEHSNNMYQTYDMLNSTFGLNWQYLWSPKGYSNTSLAHTIMKSTGDVYETLTGLHLLDNRSTEQEYKFRNTNHIRFNSSHALEFGLDAKYLITSFDHRYGAYTDRLGNVTPPMSVQEDIRALKAGASVQYRWKPWNDLTLAPGARVDYFQFTDQASVSPRLSITYDLDPLTSLTASAGRFDQHLPLVLIAQREAFRHLRNPSAMHYVLGLSHLLTENTRLTVELYDKEYRNCPLDPSQTGLFVLDEAVDAGLFLNHEQLVDDGRAYSRGVELMVQKKLAEDFYGVVAGSYFRSRYRDFDGTWRDRLYDNKMTFTLEGGYIPNPEWEFSLRWLYAGGAPYTPFDESASAELHRGVYDQTQINEARLPSYHSLNIRADRRFHFNASTLILYLSIWNVYGRKNVAHYTWNQLENTIRAEEMWGTFPVFGIEYEF